MTGNHDAIRQRLQLLEGYIQQLKGFRQRTLADVRNDVSLAWAIEHGLQISIQCVIDVCQYLVAGLSLGTPTTSQEAIELLHDAGLFPATFSESLIRMTRFRNILVHLYARVNVERVYDHLQNHLGDFTQFGQYVLDFLTSQEADGST